MNFYRSFVDASSMPRNIGVRGPRHTVLLRDRVPVRHCEFPEETARMMYNPSKLDIENVRASYTPPEHQVFLFLFYTIRGNISMNNEENNKESVQ